MGQIWLGPNLVTLVLKNSVILLFLTQSFHLDINADISAHGSYIFSTRRDVDGCFMPHLPQVQC